MAKPKIKHTITKKEWNKKHKDFKLMGKDGIPYITMYDDKIGTHLVPVKIIDESLDESAFSEIDILAKEAGNFKSFVKDFFKSFKDFPKNRDTTKWLEDLYKSAVSESVNEGTKYKVGQKTPVGKIVGTSVWGKGSKQEWFYDVQKPGYAPKQYSEKSLDKIMGESVNELDINDPIMMKLRAAQMTRNKDAAKKVEKEKKINPDYKALKNATKIKALKKKRAEVMRDMEQEAEPEGGKIADRYGKLLNKIDNDIIKLGGNPMSEGMVKPKSGHTYYQLTKDTPIKFIKSQSGMNAPGVFLHNKDGFIKGKKDAYLIDYFGAAFYVDLKNKFASKIYPMKDQTDLRYNSNFKETDKAPEMSDWKKFLKESLDEAVDKADLKNAKFRLKKVLKYLDIEYKETRGGKKYVQINYIPVTTPQWYGPEFVNVRYEDENDLQNIGKALKLKLKESVNENDGVYFKSYTAAIEAARAAALKKGFEIDEDEMFTKVGMNSKRPSVGKTTRVSLELTKAGKPQRKMLHIQVYGMKNGYELNSYIN
jgi:hypothetical protein